MARELFVAQNFQRQTLEIIEQANEIIEQYTAQGYVLTLRQLYYRFVAADLIPNTVRSYKRLGSIVNNGRLAGMIDWDAIEDRTRSLQDLPHWNDPAEIVAAVAQQYREELWASQPYRVEVWIEKEALAGVFERICHELDVPFFSCRGYASQSEMYGAAQRVKGHTRNGQDVRILHFGDHDPSGIDMTRDVDDRLVEVFGADVEIKRIALNMDQVRQYDPPPNPAKETDSRAESYIERFGRSSWELDALDPPVLAALVRREVVELRDEEQWDEDLAAQEANRRLLRAVSENWSTVSGQFEDGEG